MAGAARSPLMRRAAAGVGCGAGSLALIAAINDAKLQAAEAPSVLPPFSLTKPKYDQSTFQGRLDTTYEIIDPRTLFIPMSEVEKCQALLKSFEDNGEKIPPGVTNEELWEARKKVSAVLHPVTKEPQLKIGRMACFVPMNVPICAIMLTASGTYQQLAAQWLNQSYNMLNNYVNRSGATVEWTPLLTSYGCAVTVAMGVALGAGALVRKVPKLSAFGPFVPYIAVATAGSANQAFTRSEEWFGKGVPVFDREGNRLGVSAAAGKIAVKQTIITRAVCLPMVPMCLPPVVIAATGVTGFAAKAVELTLIIMAFSVGLPICLSLLPMEMELDATDLEPEFQSMKDSNGNLITKVYGNKGL